MKVHVYVKERSERVPRKNFRHLGGGPLWKRQLLKFCDHEVFLDTDSREILAEVEGSEDLSHVTAYARLLDHAQDPNPGLAMTWRFLEEFVARRDEPVAVVHVTSPFLRVETVERAWEEVEAGKFDSAASVTEVRDFCYRRGGRGELVPLNHDGRHIPGTQDLEPVVHLNHAFYVLSHDSLSRWGHRVGDRPLLVPLRHPESIDIDWEEDFRLAEAVLASGVRA